MMDRTQMTAAQVKALAAADEVVRLLRESGIDAETISSALVTVASETVRAARGDEAMTNWMVAVAATVINPRRS